LVTSFLTWCIETNFLNKIYFTRLQLSAIKVPKQVRLIQLKKGSAPFPRITDKKLLTKNVSLT